MNRDGADCPIRNLRLSTAIRPFAVNSYGQASTIWEKLKLTPDKKILKSDGEDLIFVRVSVLDADGNEVPTAEPLIKATLDGPGKIVATDNGDPTCLIPFPETTRPAFNGLYLAIVKADRGAKGELHFSVESDGLGTAEMVFQIEKGKIRQYQYIP